MKLNKKHIICSGRYFLLFLILSLIISVKVGATDYYAVPDGAGNNDGSSWNNAIKGEDIEYFVNTVMKGGDKLFLDDNGSYFYDLQINITNGGADKHATKIIEGVDRGEGYPIMKGSGRSNGVFIFLNASVSYLSIRNLNVEDYKYVVETEEDIARPNQYITIDGLDINNVTDGLYLRDFRNSTIKNCEVTYHTKRGVRLRTGCRNLKIIDCFTDHNMGNFGDFPSNQFPVGFEVGEGRHDTDSLDQTNITFIRCEARNCIDDDQSYYNGDGFLVNDKHHNIAFYDCIAYGNADGGWDNKGVDVYFENCIAVANKNNIRVWHSATLVNCLTANPHRYEGPGGYNIWLDGKWGDAIVDMYNCTSHNGPISSSEKKVQIEYAENCIFSAGIDNSWIASGDNNVYTENFDDPDYLAPSDEYNGHPMNAYNSQKYGPDRGYWFVEGEKPVISELEALPSLGDTPLTVEFTITAGDPDGQDTNLNYVWILSGGEISSQQEFSYTFNVPGEYEVICRVVDEDYLSASDTVCVTVTGNYPPEVAFLEPFNQQFFFVDQTINITIDATDRDGQIDSLHLYLDNNHIETKSSAPYEFMVPGLPEGVYTMTTRAYDDDAVFVDDSIKINVIVPITLFNLSWDGYVNLYWEDHLNGVTNDFGDLSGYNIYRSTVAGGEYVKINNSIIDTTVFKDTAVVNGTQYYYVVTSENTSGNESGFSNEVIAKPQVSFKLACTDDAYVRDGKYDNNNYGSEPDLIVKNASEDWQRFSYLKFDLSSLGAISKAALRIKSNNTKERFHSVKCYLAATDSWTEELINWKNKPDTTSLIEITKVPGSKSWIEFDLTSEVRTELSGDKAISLVLLKIEHGNPGYTFFSKEADGKDNHPILHVIPEDLSEYKISAGAESGGSITPHGEISVFVGFDQSFTIEPDSGYLIEDIRVDDISKGSISKFIFTDVSADHTIKAYFSQIPTYIISSSAGNGGSIDPEGNITVYEGDSLGFAIKPENEYEIADVLVDGVSVGVVNTYIFNNITANHSIEAGFDKITAIRKNPEEIISFYPNPAKEEIIFSPQKEMINVEIVNINGQLIKTFKNICSDITLHVCDLDGDGVYLVKAFTQHKTVIKKLIIISQ